MPRDHAFQAEDGNLIEATRQFERAIELSPNFATAHQWLAEPLAITGRYEEALAALRAARSLDPLALINRTQTAELLAPKTIYRNHPRCRGNPDNLGKMERCCQSSNLRSNG